tara:strand:- start:765 stop:1430 length:666 start_codon:yes stop_codon:yes gene_type:complete
MEKNVKTYLLTIPIAALALSACSSQGTITQAVVIEEQRELVEKQIERMPKWFTKIPVKDESIFAVGTAVTPDLQLSYDIAVLNAKTTLADRINGKVRSQTKNFIAKVGSTDLDVATLNEVEKVTKNIIADVDVAGYAVSEAEVFPDGTQYRAFVLLEYNDLEANKIIVNRLRKDRLLYSKLRSNKAFQELDKAVDDIKIEESNESEINLKLEELVPNDNMG